MSELSPNAIVANLKAQGLRVTPQRYAVYTNLLGRRDHPTVEQLLADLNQGGPVSSQATVYNSLQALREVGLIREVLLEEGVSRYDANVSPHHHFRCRCCGCIEDIPWDAFGPLAKAALRPGLQPESYEVTVQGICDRCSSPNNPCDAG
ncbi:Fur family transcriptional regulator [Leptolyngbya sp. PCC 6406]|uniref:Fur family transcriptional regulator n=1 Tax=Leptolyngbya sp. PCC 6406 TaxID=1173264 RepID=UPI0002ACD67F|nr:Fur family transcriptional regulator [Leptolyngbya sp. PCC 6406]